MYVTQACTFTLRALNFFSSPIIRVAKSKDEIDQTRSTEPEGHSHAVSVHPTLPLLFRKRRFFSLGPETGHIA
jgi:hypothetical protein